VEQLEDRAVPSVTLGIGLGAPSTTMAGATLTYNLGVGNEGPDAAQNFRLTDQLPSSVTFVSQTQTSGPAFSLSYSGGQVSDTIASQPASSAASFSIVVSVPSYTPNNTSLVDQAHVATSSQVANPPPPRPASPPPSRTTPPHRP
jgi:uncharacterized repeat protein (TIGR01451 family)